MNQTSNFTVLSAPILAWTDLTLISAQMLVTSAQVIGYRTSRIMLAGATPDSQDEREFTMMSEEKTAAAVKSAQAMAQGMFMLGQQLAVMTGRQMMASVPLMISLAASATPQQSIARQANLARAGLASATEANHRIATSIPRIASKDLKPINTKATANRKRLHKHATARALNKASAHHSGR